MPLNRKLANFVIIQEFQLRIGSFFERISHVKMNCVAQVQNDFNKFGWNRQFCCLTFEPKFQQNWTNFLKFLFLIIFLYFFLNLFHKLVVKSNENFDQYLPFKKITNSGKLAKICKSFANKVTKNFDDAVHKSRKITS